MVIQQQWEKTMYICLKSFKFCQNIRRISFIIFSKVVFVQFRRVLRDFHNEPMTVRNMYVYSKLVTESHILFTLNVDEKKDLIIICVLII